MLISDLLLKTEKICYNWSDLDLQIYVLIKVSKFSVFHQLIWKNLEILPQVSRLSLKTSIWWRMKALSLLLNTKNQLFKKSKLQKISISPTDNKLNNNNQLRTNQVVTWFNRKIMEAMLQWLICQQICLLCLKAQCRRFKLAVDISKENWPAMSTKSSLALLYSNERPLFSSKKRSLLLILICWWF